jgi:hypothetical protein
MAKQAAITEAELALMLEALDDAAYYRDTRSRVLRNAVERGRRGAPLPKQPEGSATDEHRNKARAYEALAAKLRADRRRP